MDLPSAQKVLGYRFINEKILEQAFTHRSYLNEHHAKINQAIQHNERLEFLGDSILELIVTDFLFKTYQDFPEGKLTAIRSSLVNYKTLGAIATDLGFNDFINLSKGERADTNERSRLPILADCFEAVLGAMYIDGGLEPCAIFLKRVLLYKSDLIVQNEAFRDSKSRLQEYHQSQTKSTPYYKVVAEEGKEHDKLFTVAVLVDSNQLSTGVGRSKQEAELDAATNALLSLKDGVKY
jgi:ribonuclease-3